MSKGKSYFGRLKKSTKITVISCGLFVAVTMGVLLFFVMNPITPSEKVIAGFGRENISRRNNQTTEVTTTTAMTTTAMEDIIVSKAATTTAAETTTHVDYTITVTSGSGFYVNNVIPTGVSPYEAGSVVTTETASDYDDGTGYDYGYGYDDGTGYDYGYGYDDYSYGYDNSYDYNYDYGYYGY